MGTGCDQSSVESWLVQPIKELSSAAGRCAVMAVNILGNWLIEAEAGMIIYGQC